MNVYLIDAGIVNFGSRTYYDPPDFGHLVELVVAPTRGAARYKLWKDNRSYLGDLNETHMLVKIIKRNVNGPSRCINGMGDELYKLWGTREVRGGV